MNFLFVANTRRNPNEGAAGCDIATIDALRALGHSVDEVWTGEWPRRVRHPNLHQLLELPGMYARAVAQRCAVRRYDVIQVNQPHAYRAAREHRLQGRPGLFINRSHGWEPCVHLALARYGVDSRPAWRRVASRILAMPLAIHNELVVRWSDGVIVCNEDDRDFILKRHPGAGGRVLALAPGLSEQYLGAGPAPGAARFQRLLYVGNFMPQKAPEVTAAVFRSVLRACPEASATWVCAAKDHAAVARMIGEPEVSRVTLVDWMARVDLRSVFDTHGLFVFPSHVEGFGLAFLEAMARGLCVLGARVGGMRELIEDGVNGFLFEPRQVEQFSRVALELLSDTERCRRIGELARRTALRYTWESTARAYLAFCGRLQALGK